MSALLYLPIILPTTILFGWALASARSGDELDASCLFIASCAILIFGLWVI